MEQILLMFIKIRYKGQFFRTKMINLKDLLGFYLSVVFKNTLLFVKTFSIDFTIIVNCNTFSMVPSKINEKMFCFFETISSQKCKEIQPMPPPSCKVCL
jgi:hypothetical protein